jgi:hypothetical protein
VRFTEINLFGVYVAPMSLMMVAAWVITVCRPFGLLRYCGTQPIRVRRLHDRAKRLM